MKGNDITFSKRELLTIAPKSDSPVGKAYCSFDEMQSK